MVIYLLFLLLYFRLTASRFRIAKRYRSVARRIFGDDNNNNNNNARLLRNTRRTSRSPSSSQYTSRILSSIAGDTQDERETVESLSSPTRRFPSERTRRYSRRRRPRNVGGKKKKQLIRLADLSKGVPRAKTASSPAPAFRAARVRERRSHRRGRRGGASYVLSRGVPLAHREGGSRLEAS